MKRVLAFILAAAMTLALVGCGAKPSDVPAGSSSGTTPQQDERDTIEITLPAALMEDVSDDDLDVNTRHFRSVTRNEDGSVTFVLEAKEHKEVMESLAEEIQDYLDEMPGSDVWTNVVKAEANEDFSVFTITTTSTEPTLSESFSVIALYVLGDIYGLFNGTDVQDLNVHVDFVNADSGEIIASSDSSEIGLGD